MIPTDAEFEVAVDAAAEEAYRRAVDYGRSSTWRELPPDDRIRFRALVEPLVVVTLEALPDRAVAGRREALEQVGLRVRTHLCTCGSAGAPSAAHEHWCPGSVVDGELE